MPGLSLDNLIFGLRGEDLKVLLVKHSSGVGVGQWALPGGFLRIDEDLRDGAERLLYDLTGVKHLFLEQLGAFGKVDRFPKARVVTIAYYALVSADDYDLVAGMNASEALWFDVREVPTLVFDHSRILESGLKSLQQKIRREPVGFNLLPEKFTLLQLQELYEAILELKLDKPNFRRKMMKMNLLKSCNEKQKGVAHRAANLYRFDKEAYEQLTKQGFVFEA